MKVSVFDVRLANGTTGLIMMPSVEATERGKVSEMFTAGDFASCTWEYNMWISETISAPVIMRKCVNEGGRE